MLLGGSIAGAGSANDPVVKRLQDLYPVAERYSVDVAHTRMKAGAARVLVKAPLATTTAVVTDFANYKSVLRHFERSDIVAKHGDQTDVAVRVGILNGRSRIEGILRFDPPRKVGDETVVYGHMIEGNVNRFEATFRLSEVDPQNTVMKLEMLIEPKLPFPNVLVTRETADVSDNAVGRLRRASEKRFKP